ncbi:MAG TPA: twin-arginine translocation signal domain-containing protein, partial [Thermoanaerobaculia bacterium]|nr:twin-arginine translocation signal domain-containing protein [Thermoanaerobaculia bacterium]
MSKLSRRDFFKATGAAGLGAALPAGALAHGNDGRGDDDDA